MKKTINLYEKKQFFLIMTAIINDDQSHTIQNGTILLDLLTFV